MHALSRRIHGSDGRRLVGLAGSRQALVFVPWPRSTHVRAMLLLQVSAVFQCFKGLLAGGKARRQNLDQRRQGEDFDDEEAEAMEVLFWPSELLVVAPHVRAQCGWAGSSLPRILPS